MDAPQPIDRIVLINTRAEALSVELVARIDEKGDLVLEGWDRGTRVQELTDDWDYEYWLRLARDYKDTVLLHLIKERFANDGELMQWLKEKNIPYEFESF